MTATEGVCTGCVQSRVDARKQPPTAMPTQRACDETVKGKERYTPESTRSSCSPATPLCRVEEEKTKNGECCVQE